MSARAVWKGVLKLGKESVPVKLYSAVSDKSVSFRLLHRDDGVPVKQAMVDPSTEEVVEYEDIARGFEADDGSIVALDQQELEDLEPEGSRDIEVSRFVPPGAIEHRWYDRAYYLGPDEDEESYMALTAALGRLEREGVAHWVMRDKRYNGALRLHAGYPMLITLRYAGEVLPLERFEPAADDELGKKQVAMARQLITMLAEDFDPDAYQDDYRERVLDLIEAKRRGRTVKPKKRKERPATDDLTSALERSLREGDGGEQDA